MENISSVFKYVLNREIEDEKKSLVCIRSTELTMWHLQITSFFSFTTFAANALKSRVNTILISEEFVDRLDTNVVSVKVKGFS